jgi:predicted phage-related endonuclease
MQRRGKVRGGGIVTGTCTTLGAAPDQVIRGLAIPQPAAIERIAITSREQWLALRQQDVTASAIAALLGESEYQSAYSLWAEKSGLLAEHEDDAVIDDWSITLSPMGRGTLFEDKAAELLRRLKPDWLVVKCSDYFRDPATRIGATPDFLVNDPARGCGILQVKNPEQSIYRTKWRQDDGAIEPPLAYVLQTNVEAHLTGAKWAAVGALVIGHRTEFRLIEIPIHADIMNRMRAEVAAFWRMVESGTPPDVDYARDGNLLAQLYGDDDGTEIDLSASNHLPILVDERDALKTQIKIAAARCGEIETEFKAALGPHSAGLLSDGRRVTWRTQNRNGYTAEPTSFRALRFGNAKERS